VPWRSSAGRSANASGGSFLTAYRDSANRILTYTVPIGGATISPPAAGDLDGDGLPEIVVASTRTTSGDNAFNCLSIANWEIFNDPLLPTESADFGAYVVLGGTFSAPVLADLNRDGTLEVVVSDRLGSLHALDFKFAPHIGGDLPNQYVSAVELPGWPTPPLEHGAVSEVSIADLEHDGHPEVIHTGAAAASPRRTTAARSAADTPLPPGMPWRRRTPPRSGPRSSPTWTGTASWT